MKAKTGRSNHSRASEVKDSKGGEGTLCACSYRNEPFQQQLHLLRLFISLQALAGRGVVCGTGRET
jgi:hypothetical protein